MPLAVRFIRPPAADKPLEGGQALTHDIRDLLLSLTNIFIGLK